jgi:hypothetical protein
MALKRILFGSAAIAGGLLALSGQSSAQLLNAGTFKNLTNEQTGPTPFLRQARSLTLKRGSPIPETMHRRH